MAWYSSGFRKRAAITYDFSNGTATDYNITIPATWDDFWDEIDADGDELRVTYANGVTLCDYAVDDGSGGAFDATNRLGRIQVDALTTPAGACMGLLWVYYGTDGAEGDASTSVTIGSPQNGYIEIGRPTTHVALYEPQRPGVAQPRQTIHKGASETVHVWVRVDQALEGPRSPGYGVMRFEELFGLTVKVYNSAGSDQTSMYTLIDCRFAEFGRQMWVKLEIKAGTTATSYTIAAQMLTTSPAALLGEWVRALEGRIGLSVRDVLLS